MTTADVTMTLMQLLLHYIAAATTLVLSTVLTTVQNVKMSFL